MPIHLVIQEKRHALGLTQEQLAQQLGVSATAVSKWERGVCCPDLALLAPLARLLKTDVNTLLCFCAEPSDQQIAEFALTLTQTQQADGFPAAFSLAQSYLRQYPGCERLLFLLTLQLKAELLRAGLTQEVSEQYDAALRDNFKQLFDSADTQIRSNVRYQLASHCIETHEYDRAKQILDLLPERKDFPDKRPLQAALLRRQGQAHEAETLLQGALLGAANDLQMLLSLLTDVAQEAGDTALAQRYAEIAAAHVGLYELWDYGALVPRLQLATARQDCAQTLSILQEMLCVLCRPWQQSPDSIYCHVAGVRRPLDGRQFLPLLVANLESDSTYSFVRCKPEFSALLAQYRAAAAKAAP